VSSHLLSIVSYDILCRINCECTLRHVFHQKDGALASLPIGNSPFFPQILLASLENSISDLVELIRDCGELYSNEILEVTSRTVERVTELIGVRANNFVTSFVTSAMVHVDLTPVASIESALGIISSLFPS